MESEKTQNRKRYLYAYQKKYRAKNVRKELLFSHREFRLIEKSAQAHHQKITPHLKACVFAYIEQSFVVPDRDLLEKLIYEIKAIGRNINQIAYQVNTCKGKGFNERALHQQLSALESVILERLEHPPLAR